MTLKHVANSLGLRGLKAVGALARVAGVSTGTAYNWIYRNAIPQYESAVLVKAFLLTKVQEIPDQKTRRDIEVAIHDLFRRAA